LVGTGGHAEAVAAVAAVAVVVAVVAVAEAAVAEIAGTEAVEAGCARKAAADSKAKMAILTAQAIQPLIQKLLIIIAFLYHSRNDTSKSGPYMRMGEIGDFGWKRRVYGDGQNPIDQILTHAGQREGMR
jgi:hypothetical protein